MKDFQVGPQPKLYKKIISRSFRVNPVQFLTFLGFCEYNSGFTWYEDSEAKIPTIEISLIISEILQIFPFLVFYKVFIQLFIFSEIAMKQIVGYPATPRVLYYKSVITFANGSFRSTAASVSCSSRL